jgi:ABC-type branched-subunit amino acid transport system substrate-binding protein
MAVVAACGSDAPGSTSTGASASTAAATSELASTEPPTTPPAATEPPTTEGSAAPSGEPVKLMMVLDESEALGLNIEPARDGALARIERLNAEGGLAGRPVEIEFCSTEFDPAKAAACGQRAVDDSSFVAVVGSVSTLMDSVNPLLEAAGMASVGSLPLSRSDIASANVFTTNGGLVTGVGGLVVIASQDLGATSITNGRIGVEAAAQGTQLMDLVLSGYGAAPIANAVDVEPGAADVSAQVAAMAEGADAVVLSVSAELFQQILQARSQLGIDIPFVASDGQISAEALTALGAAADGTPVAAYYPTDDSGVPGVKTYLADLEAIDAASSSGGTAKNAWLAIDLLAHAVGDAGTIDRASVLAAMQAVNGYDSGGLTPVLDYTAAPPNPLFPRLFNLTFFAAEIRDGKLVAATDAEVRPVFAG